MSVMVMTEMIYLASMSASDLCKEWNNRIHTHVYRYTFLQHLHKASDEDSLRAERQSRMDEVGLYE